MIKHSAHPQSELLLSKIEHLGSKNVPSGSVLLGTLKPFEQALTSKGVLSHPSPVPLWFLAETERNTFLWKNGLSLIHSSYFEFWVQVDALIAKREDQLNRITPENPFSGVLWGTTAIDPSAIELERAYLIDIKSNFERIALHAECLCHATREVLNQISPRVPVVLPFQKMRAGSFSL